MYVCVLGFPVRKMKYDRFSIIPKASAMRLFMYKVTAQMTDETARCHSTVVLTKKFQYSYLTAAG